MVLIPVRVSTRRLVVIASITTVLAVGALGIMVWGATHAGGPPRGGLTQTQAIQAAWEHVDRGAIGVASSEVRQDFNTGFDLPVHHWSWVVTFYGRWQLLCQGACDRTTEWVAIDYSTGNWIASQYSYPSR